MKLVRGVLVVSAVTLATLGSSVAQANTITGSLFRVAESVTLNAVPANVPATTPNVTFDVNSPFTFATASSTVGAWLASGSAFNIVENTPNTLTAQMDNGTTGTLLNFIGFVTVVNGMMFTVAHDDGLTLIIGGIDLGFNPGPTAPTVSTETYNGPSGTFPFQLVYAECCGGPAVLHLDLPLSNTPTPSTVPEPATLTLLGTGLAIVARKRVLSRR